MCGFDDGAVFGFTAASAAVKSVAAVTDLQNNPKIPAGGMHALQIEREGVSIQKYAVIEKTFDTPQDWSEHGVLGVKVTVSSFIAFGDLGKLEMTKVPLQGALGFAAYGRVTSHLLIKRRVDKRDNL